ncbi:MAG: homoserine kinase [Streptosporangiales bacterium]
MVTAFTSGPVRVRVPATSANLGPAFDCAGLALARYDEIEVRVTASGLTVEVGGEGAGDLRRDERHLVVRAARAAFDELGEQPPGLELRCTNAIPHGRGLGSSAAAIVGGVVAARALAGRTGDEATGRDALALAARLEGHPDNVAACLAGGLTFAWQGDVGIDTFRVDPHPRLEAVAVLPRERVRTKAARGLLPVTVPHGDAAANAARATLLAPALAENPELLLAATRDSLHQGYRRQAMPRTLELVDRLRAAGHAAVVSGAGPTVLVLGTARMVPAAITVIEAVEPTWRVERLQVDRTGTTLRAACAARIGGEEC